MAEQHARMPVSRNPSVRLHVLTERGVRILGPWSLAAVAHHRASAWVGLGSIALNCDTDSRITKPAFG